MQNFVKLLKNKRKALRCDETYIGGRNFHWYLYEIKVHENIV